MAGMIEALSLKKGMRVLEIGTGTGYNAALLALLTEQEIRSLDIDAELVTQAQQRLRQGGYRVQVLVGDGHNGSPDGAPYDRIIATGAVHAIPAAWRDQLAEGGILVCHLQGSLATPLVRLVKHTGYVAGTCLATPGFFLLLQHAPTPPWGQRLPWQAYDRLPVREEAHTTLDLPALLQGDAAFRLFVECALPGLSLAYRFQQEHQRLLTCLRHGQTLLTFLPEPGGYLVQVRGTIPLWSHLLAASDAWHQQGKPSLHQYTVRITQDGFPLYARER
uniref:Protein-L-isoaspartate O-methyltransferase n=1 Tax=Thermosporothrix sp. COM3 TaxID=2490863 RepID=A0A455S9X2_9CHLR|nr:hypothetical protein KTC_00080 [Thermosporothrix sp. COM3]